MFTVHKSEGKAWLKEDAVLKPVIIPENGNWQPGEIDRLQEKQERYENHIASRRTIQIATEYVDYWAEGAKVKEGEFATKRGKQIDFTDQQQWQEMSVGEKDVYFERIAIPKANKDDKILLDALEAIVIGCKQDALGLSHEEKSKIAVDAIKRYTGKEPFEHLAIPAQDEAGLWDEVWNEIVDVLYNWGANLPEKKTTLISRFKKHYSIKSKSNDT